MDKKNGGLGLKNLEIMNDALMGRLVWNVVSKPTALCLKVLSGKYRRECDLSKECKVLKSDSETWKNLGRIWPSIISNFVWEVGNGKKTRFWDDVWVDVGCNLIDKRVGPSSAEDQNVMVSDMANEKGCWDTEKIGEEMSESGQQLIMAVSPPKTMGGEDRNRWGCNLVNKYNVADMYHCLKDE